MLHAQIDGCSDVALPVGEGFLGETEHQVDADVADADAAKPFYGSLHLGSIVATMKKAEAMV